MMKLPLLNAEILQHLLKTFQKILFLGHTRQTYFTPSILRYEIVLLQWAKFHSWLAVLVLDVGFVFDTNTSILYRTDYHELINVILPVKVSNADITNEEPRNTRETETNNLYLLNHNNWNKNNLTVRSDKRHMATDTAVT